MKLLILMMKMIVLKFLRDINEIFSNDQNIDNDYDKDNDDDDGDDAFDIDYDDDGDDDDDHDDEDCSELFLSPSLPFFRE